MYRLLLAVMLLVQLPGYGQIDQRKLDSLSRAIDSSSSVYKKQQDVIIKTQDSFYHSEINKNLQSSNADHSVIEQKQKEEQRQRGLLSLVTGIVLFLILAVVLFRKRKKKI